MNKNKKIVKLVILLIILLIGGTLLTLGIVKTNNAKKTNEKRYDKAVEEVKEHEAIDAKRVKEIPTLIDELEKEKKDSTSSERISEIDNEIERLEMEKDGLGNKHYVVNYDKVSEGKYIIFIILGAGIILVECILAGVVFKH